MTRAGTKLQVSYYESLDILLLQNGCQWNTGGNVAEGVVAFADAQRNTVAIEVTGARSFLRQILFEEEPSKKRERHKSFDFRPNEADLDRVSLPLIVIYDRDTDTLTLDSGLPTPFEFAIADGLIAYYDGEDEHGKFINAVSLENAAKLLKPYLAP